jgi:hypothetical protein
MRKVPSSATTGPPGGAMCSIESFSSTVVIPQSALATIARRVPDRRKRTRKGARSPVRASSTSSRYAPKSSTATPTVWRTPGSSPSVSQVTSSVKAGLKVSSGLAREASAGPSAFFRTAYRKWDTTSRFTGLQSKIHFAHLDRDGHFCYRE